MEIIIGFFIGIITCYVVNLWTAPLEAAKLSQDSMTPKIIKKGEPRAFYDFVCPECGSIVRYAENDLQHYEDCYDIPMVETNERCPNCHKVYINVRESELYKYKVEK